MFIAILCNLIDRLGYRLTIVIWYRAVPSYNTSTYVNDHGDKIYPINYNKKRK